MDIEAREAIWHVCVANAVPELAQWIECEWSTRLTANFGYAKFTEGKIVISNRLREESRLFQYQWIGHLVAHMVVRYNWMKTNVCQSFPKLHGREWQEAMNCARIPVGVEICAAPLPERRASQTFFCLCSRDIVLNQKLAKRIQESKKRDVFCRRCDTPIMFLRKGSEHVHQN